MFFLTLPVEAVFIFFLYSVYIFSVFCLCIYLGDSRDILGGIVPLFPVIISAPESQNEELTRCSCFGREGGVASTSAQGGANSCNFGWTSFGRNDPKRGLQSAWAPTKPERSGSRGGVFVFYRRVTRLPSRVPRGSRRINKKVRRVVEKAADIIPVTFVKPRLRRKTTSLGRIRVASLVYVIILRPFAFVPTTK